ncbi:hypothetical protein AXG93_4207s1030 [Marchantia polymorpha subsp. ruderalis]|uniref:CCHC-type domain-containing protein n=1 Tax=Marchantia polymorpha subsp. ruderalis TaxID=1480154 RepID=A0A176VZ65_MARPO|nr:hypothetical protein AXG93_4207s1030 [Marchantia polymorpha subsp. ruderalis]
MPSEEARRPLGHGRRHAAAAKMLVTEKCLASKQVPFDDSTSGQESAAQRTLDLASSAQTQLEQPAADEGRKEDTRVPSAQTPLAQAPSTIVVWAEILGTEDDTGSEEEEVKSVREEVVRQTRLLEQSELARKANEELLRRLQSQCDKLRAQRAEAELQLVKFEGHNRRATDRTREESVILIKIKDVKIIGYKEKSKFRSKYLDRKTMVCWRCGKSDHVKKNCRVKTKGVDPSSANVTQDFDANEDDLLEDSL